MKIAFLDIETTNLVADIGFILCIGYECMEIGKKGTGVKITRIDESKNYSKKLYDDSKCVKDIAKWLNTDNPDFLVHYNGDSFDIPYIQSRLIKIGAKSLPPFRSIDHWKTSRYKLRLHSFSLDTLAKHLNIPEQKTHFDTTVWLKASYGDKGCMNKIVSHCRIDIKILEKCHEKVVPVLRSMRGLY